MTDYDELDTYNGDPVNDMEVDYDFHINTGELPDEPTAWKFELPGNMVAIISRSIFIVRYNRIFCAQSGISSVYCFAKTPSERRKRGRASTSSMELS